MENLLKEEDSKNMKPVQSFQLHCQIELIGAASVPSHLKRCPAVSGAGSFLLTVACWFYILKP